MFQQQQKIIFFFRYANVPDAHFLNPSKNIGLKEYNSSVLIHNWYEERNKVNIEKK